MAIAIAHLSDIHIRRPTDPVLARGAQIAAAIAGAAGPTADCLIVVTGDIAFSGLQREYALALDLFKSINEALRAAGKQPTFAYLPGNHDCDFSEPDAVRGMLVDAVRTNAKQAGEPAVQSHCTRAQAEFFEFVTTCKSHMETLSWSGAIASEIDYKGFHLRLLNSAWMSSYHENPATLVYPITVISEQLSKVTITCLHHPPQWFTNQTRRELWRAIAQRSDLVLTGHEHDPEQTTIESRTEQTLHSHFEAGALQTDSPDASEFAVYVLDSSAQSYRNYSYEWNKREKSYVCPAITADQPRPKEKQLPLNKLRSHRQFEFSDKHQGFLAALNMNITHQVVGNLRLQDIFVYPDLNSTKLTGDSSGARTDSVKGPQVIDLIEKGSLVLITGEKYAGKTALAKMLCVDLHQRGYVPVHIRLSKRLRTIESWVDAIERAFCEQYAPELLQKFQTLPAASKIVVVDDVDTCVGDADSLVSILSGLISYSSRVVLIAEPAALGARLLVRFSQEQVEHYTIRPFGYLQRDRLVQKWLLLGGDQLDAAALLRKLHETTKNINSIIGKGFVPSYPFFVLTILYAADSAVQLEARTSAHGYYFEQLIRTELLRGRQDHAKLDVTLGALAFIAYRFFSTNIEKMVDHELRRAVEDYEVEYALKVDYRLLVDHLVERRMLSTQDSSYVFAYDYVYYFFTARYLARNIDKAEIKDAVRKLCRATGIRRYGDILLFLAHLSNDPFVIAEMVSGADDAFKGHSAVDLRADLSIVGEFADVVEKCIYEETDALTIRREVMEEHDENTDDVRSMTHTARDDEQIELVNQLLAAVRNMEVVGQVLKNNPGHLDATRKLEIATAAYGVGARIWRWFLHVLAAEQRELIDELIKHVKGENPAITPAELKQEVSGALVSLVRMASFGMVKRIALSIGAPELGATYRKLVERIGGDAPALVCMSIHLDCMPGSPEGDLANLNKELQKNPLGIWILQRLVLEHLHIFQFESAEKQRLCAAVGIEYKSGLGTGQKQKLLPKG